MVYSFQAKELHQRKSVKGNINKANIIDSVSVTPKPSKRKGNNINQISGYNNKTIKARGQHSTNKMAQSIIPVNILMDKIEFLRRIKTN
ncbi:hypothetical protein ADICYQ_0987 [Cyclobacterium qasimii M12-11B]|uniref:Uncharacterized protein n=1 Tax=Cyclobacterium qasimii M12-11B TaxID=641524 RepID=S7X369_9BACT|nr:hypothetical protein ADICYQ_0987 [Cyclobacterium qasimii M12-11B]